MQRDARQRTFFAALSKRLGVSALMLICLGYPVLLRAADSHFDDLTAKKAVPALPPIPPIDEATAAIILLSQADDDTTASAQAELATEESDQTEVAAEETDQAEVAAEETEDAQQAVLSDDDSAQTADVESQPASDSPASDSPASDSPASETQSAATDSTITPVEGDAAEEVQQDTPRSDSTSEVVSDDDMDIELVAQPVSDQVQSLSVQPGRDPLIPEDYEKWILDEPTLEGDVHRIVVSSAPTLLHDNLSQTLDGALVRGVADYLDEIGLVQGRDFHSIRSKITADYIRKNLIENPDGYTAEIVTPDGAMYQKWVRLSITGLQRDQIRNWHQEAAQLDRVPAVGLGVAGLLGLIGLTHLVLRRRHGLPAQSASDLPEVAGEAPPRRSLGVFGLLATLFFLGLVPVMFAFLFLGAPRRQVHVVNEVQVQEVTRAHAEALRTIENIRSIQHPNVVVPALPELPTSASSTTINTQGNQEVILKIISRTSTQ